MAAAEQHKMFSAGLSTLVRTALGGGGEGGGNGGGGGGGGGSAASSTTTLVTQNNRANSDAAKQHATTSDSSPTADRLQLVAAHRSVRNMRIDLSELRAVLDADRRTRAALVRDVFVEISRRVQDAIAASSSAQAAAAIESARAAVATADDNDEHRLAKRQRQHQAALSALEGAIE